MTKRCPSCDFVDQGQATGAFFIACPSCGELLVEIDDCPHCRSKGSLNYDGSETLGSYSVSTSQVSPAYELRQALGYTTKHPAINKDSIVWNPMAKLQCAHCGHKTAKCSAKQTPLEVVRPVTRIPSSAMCTDDSLKAHLSHDFLVRLLHHLRAEYVRAEWEESTQGADATLVYGQVAEKLPFVRDCYTPTSSRPSHVDFVSFESDLATLSEYNAAKLLGADDDPPKLKTSCMFADCPAPMSVSPQAEAMWQLGHCTFETYPAGTEPPYRFISR